jgi:hypothetical protein
MTANGNRVTVNASRGLLVEYTRAPNKPLRLEFEFNPSSITRTRSVTVHTGGAPGTRGGYDFENESQAARAALGANVNAESFSVRILLDATDRMNAGDRQASTEGIQPELDVIRSMLEPKTQAPQGERTLAALGHGSQRAFSRHEYVSVLLFSWGPQRELPVFMTQAQLELKEFLPNLRPYRAEATLSLQVIESINPKYITELRRQFASAGQAVEP